MFKKFKTKMDNKQTIKLRKKMEKNLIKTFRVFTNDIIQELKD